MTDREDVLRLLSRLLASGRLERLPKKRAEAHIILALAAAELEPDRTYTERGINDRLSSWLEGFVSPAGLDHVTLRRDLVDAGYLERDPSGRVYRTCRARLDTVLTKDARSVCPEDVLASLNVAREARRRAHTKSLDG